MRIGVPGEFHEDRWPRTAEDSERLVDPAHTGSVRSRLPSSAPVKENLWIPRTRKAEGAHRIQVIAWRSVLLTGLRPDLRPYSWPLRSGSGSRSALRHGDLACRCLSGIPAWQRGSSGRSSARRPYPQVDQWHSRGATVSWCTG